jgi:hypothetical protein
LPTSSSLLGTKYTDELAGAIEKVAAAREAAADPITLSYEVEGYGASVDVSAAGIVYHEIDGGTHGPVL